MSVDDLYDKIGSLSPILHPYIYMYIYMYMYIYISIIYQLYDY